VLPIDLATTTWTAGDSLFVVRDGGAVFDGQPPMLPAAAPYFAEPIPVRVL
jgi:hypothetical protein